VAGLSGFRVEEAAAAEDAIEKARRLRPDLITTEIQLEGADKGLQLCAELKKSAETRGIPIIAVTEWEMGECVEKARGRAVISCWSSRACPKRSWQKSSGS